LLRNWRIHIWVILPSVLPMPDGKLPEKFQTIDVFPETELCDNGKNRIPLKKNRHENRKQSNYLLETFIQAQNPKEVFELLGSKVEKVLDMLSFQLQHPIWVTYVEVLNWSNPLKIGEKREWAFANTYPRVQKDSHFEFMSSWKTLIDPATMEKKIEPIVEAARALNELSTLAIDTWSNQEGVKK